jgi:hypothetical protein
MADDFIVKPLPLDDDLSDFTTNETLVGNSPDFVAEPLVDNSPDFVAEPLVDNSPEPVSAPLDDTSPEPAPAPTYKAAPLPIGDEVEIPGLIMYDPNAEYRYFEKRDRSVPKNIEPISLDNELNSIETIEPISLDNKLNSIETIEPISLDNELNSFETIEPISLDNELNSAEIVKPQENVQPFLLEELVYALNTDEDVEDNFQKTSYNSVDTASYSETPVPSSDEIETVESDFQEAPVSSPKKITPTYTEIVFGSSETRPDNSEKGKPATLFNSEKPAPTFAEIVFGSSETLPKNPEKGKPATLFNSEKPAPTFAEVVFGSSENDRQNSEKETSSPFAEVVVPTDLFDPFANTEEKKEENLNVPPIPGLVIFDPVAEENSVQNEFAAEESPVYDEDIDFSLDDVTVKQFEKPVTVNAPEIDTRFDDIEEVSFDEIKVEKIEKKTLDDIDIPVFDEIVVENKQKSTLDDVEDVTFAEATEIKVEKKTLDDIEEPVLAVADAPETEYKPKFIDPSLEEAKKSAKANANKAALASNDVDPKKALESMREFKMEQEREMAKKGFKLVFLFLFLGLIACGTLYLFSTEIVTKFSDGATFSNKIRPYIPYACGITGIFTFLLLIPSSSLKGFTSFLYFLMLIVSIVSCFMLFGKQGNFFINIGMVAVPLALFLVNLIVLSSNDKIEMYYKHKDV